MEQPQFVGVQSISEPLIECENVSQSNLAYESNQYIASQIDEHEDVYENHIVPASVTSRHYQDDTSGGASLYYTDVKKNIDSFHHEDYAYEQNEGKQPMKKGSRLDLQGISLPTNVSTNDNWPVMEQPQFVGVQSISEPLIESENVSQSNLAYESNQYIASQIDEHEDVYENHIVPASVTSRHYQDDTSGGASLYYTDVKKNIDSFHDEDYAYEQNEGMSNILY
ncbi:hypothetical protein CTI12_AA525780 [Artemisia annua]|uniref:Uncharacterized protein n=1 Tax=Artemisia annua TaxID=35608 RepID=A0A2U1L6B8_ARTAN|nr:hypothetical protein CTI12_AA525780 [Artemisia annua]